jgi:hypothetical protein
LLSRRAKVELRGTVETQFLEIRRNLIRSLGIKEKKYLKLYPAEPGTGYY